ncbi:GNAT family N-acetyltransferase [Miniphocaeibacter halophilus]|uniref:GNAT family N-acetyltransferase n=1 Tax=Miniphocaeibacter halophilus TaxID=2931922 RepID=A0AC61MU97_9FIRM|nr:N-acetyltransferase [Miniphocaeibacter halophilus]QQK08938.1 GNAT family N-acetyltransferase [Miniphocaeibacter halophilus]
MNYTIDRAKVEDAKDLIEYLKIITGESNNLTITPKQVKELNVKDEGLIIDSYNHSPTSIMLVAKLNKEIIGMGSLKGYNIDSIIGHRVSLGVSVKKDYWNKGIGREIIDALLSYAANNEYIEIVELEVKSDNYAAISLYERFGFEEIGFFENYFKYEDGYGDAILMTLQF